MKFIIAVVSALLTTSFNLYAAEDRIQTATFAGGCFWCMEPAFDGLPGVISTTSGYTGGHQEDPTYEQVSSGTTGHTEAIQITFDSSKISYGKLLDVYWRNIDPTTADRQFCDTGTQYRSAIFFHNEDQRKAVETSLSDLRKSKSFDEAIVTEILPATAFYPAEDYHQDYYLKNPLRYKYYRTACERDKRLEILWGDPASD